MEQLLQELFLGVLNMSITASYVVLFVIIARLLLRKAPKVFSYGLWSIVLFRLICPVSFSSAISFFNLFHRSNSMEYIPSDIGLMDQPQVGLGIASLDDAVNRSLPAATPIASANPMQVLLFIFSVIWIMVAACLLIYSIISYLSLKHKIETAIRIEDNIFECEEIGSPFVIGLVKPKIYLPLGLPQIERSYILKHEQTHIKRFDYLIKPLAYFVLCIHWFNPLIWISFLLMNRDMEMSCDESVLKVMGTDIKKDYSSSLLNFAVGKRLISGSPLAFGEVSAKSRIQNILNYRKPPIWIAVITLILLIVVGFGLISNPADGQKSADQNISHQFMSQGLSSMAEIWAEALKTRDGEPRYEMMSEKMKEEFIAEQKQRSEPWNFNIGVSSPWVTDYEITVNEDSAEILYHMTDSTQGKYDKREIIYFGKENGKTVVTKTEELLSEWERPSYYALTADEAMHHYIDALLESDYSTILALTPSGKLNPDGQLIWDTIKISDVKVVKEDVRDQKACYELELTIQDPGNSAFEKGIFPRWLWLVKGTQGWYVEGLMTGGAPDESWWTARTYHFDRLLYLSLLSSSTFDYAESRMEGTIFTIGMDLFEIDYPEGNDFTIQDPVYQKIEMTDDLIKDFENSTMGKVSVSEFKERYRYNIYTEDNQKTNFCLYAMDNQMWLASYADNTADKSEIIMNLWKLK